MDTFFNGHTLDSPPLLIMRCLLQQHHLPSLYKTATFDLNKINTAWLMTAIPLDAVISYG